MFEPKLEILPEAQRALWAELAAIPTEFVLCGGTAIALQLGHRQSVDFDFFASRSFDPVQLYSSMPLLEGSTVLQQAANTLTCRVDRANPVIVSFFGVPTLRRVAAPLIAHDNHLRIASLLDLAGMKAAVVQQRAEAKDYTDLHALLVAGIGLPAALAAAGVIYGERFNPQLTLKALSFFGDGDLPSLPTHVQERIIGAVRSVNLDRLPVLSACDEPTNR
jgi:Nucleotidyl transferase AbiEii toxin, Type IV TA system